MVGNHYVYVQRNAVPFAGTFKWMSTNFHSMESVVTISSSTWISCIEADLVIGTANQGCSRDSRTGTRLVSRYICPSKFPLRFPVSLFVILSFFNSFFRHNTQPIDGKTHNMVSG